MNKQICPIHKKKMVCRDCMAQRGVCLDDKLIQKIWNWTQNDLFKLSSSFNRAVVDGEGGCGPSSGYAIFIVSLMDIWGSIVDGDFGGSDVQKHTRIILERLQDANINPRYSDYEYDPKAEGDDSIIKILRHNLVHNYGLKNLAPTTLKDSEKADQYWLNIDINSRGKIINRQGEAKQGRWHIDCLRLRDDLLLIIERWLIENKLCDAAQSKYQRLAPPTGQ